MDDDGVTRIPTQACPVCREMLTAAGAMPGTVGAPGLGDWTICSYCRAWLVYQADLRLRVVTNAEWLALSTDERVERTRQREQVREAWAQPRPE